MKRNGEGKRPGPRALASYIDPAWRMRSRGDAGIQRALHGLLGPLLEQRRIDVTTDGSTLLIACREPACATELRFLQRDIRKTLKAAGYPSIEQIRVAISAPGTAATVSVAPPAERTIPPGARQALRAAASGIADPRLADALRRLAHAGSGDG
ncbi:MAG: DUF721 domain-containing protein [Thioalkalivibrio sp.]|nr:MAG: DUF721 domain-containing protein [Thioalkalivibrio sp.]